MRGTTGGIVDMEVPIDVSNVAILNPALHMQVTMGSPVDSAMTDLPEEARQLKRFNIVVLPAPADLETEVSIVTKRVGELASSLQLKSEIPHEDAIIKIVTIFRELRAGPHATLDEPPREQEPLAEFDNIEQVLLSQASAFKVNAFLLCGVDWLSAR